MKNTSIPGSILKLRSCRQAVVIPHKSPDGDAVGSSLALMHLLNKAGVPTHVVVEDSLPYFLNFLPGAENIIIWDKKNTIAETYIQNADCIISSDYGHVSRCGVLEKFVRENPCLKIMIDHHPHPEIEAYDFLFHDITSSSTCELVFDFYVKYFSDISLDKTIATCIYAGLVTDTGCFRHALRPQTFETASELLKTGIDTEHIITKIFDVNTPQRLKLLGYCLNEKMVILPEYKTAFIHLSGEELRSFGVKKGDTEGIVNYTLSIEGIIFGAFFFEREDHTTKVSFRSKSTFPANEFSSRFFDGGGHRNAAGGQFNGPVNLAVNHFLECLPQYKTVLESLHL
ncbi:MAG: bifunctional oligoribonuclease/PAP phosphatase NrnA [Flavobacteriales bacterium]|nr:bifunctional oligoribonuclease/PAP phosphatase NrnA [Flavobacteriales bacterium]